MASERRRSRQRPRRLGSPQRTRPAVMSRRSCVPARPSSGHSARSQAAPPGTRLVTAASTVSAPQAYSIEGWSKTTTNRGGKLIGFGSSQTGRSVTFDRHIYLQNDGQLVFGVFDTKIEAIISRNVYNDGKWHFVVASLSPTAGMTLRVDGRLAGENSTTSDESYSGYWRVGGDNLAGGWNLGPLRGNSQGTTEPNRYYFTGHIGDVAVFPYALSAAQIAAQYAANRLSH